MTTNAARDNLVPCPGCGGRGKFEWASSPKVPKTWTLGAVCAVCQGSGKVPATWAAGSRSNR
jgi:DnaJ-class molecular chaperone